MNPQIVNALELVALILFVLAKVGGTCLIVSLLVDAPVSNGFKVFLIAIAIAVGLGFGIKYDNPNNQNMKCGQPETTTQSVER